MVRRNYKITSEQDGTIVRLSREMGIDKEQVVQLALERGLPAVEQSWVSAGKPRGLQLFAKALLEMSDGRINKTGAKRRP